MNTLDYVYYTDKNNNTIPTRIITSKGNKVKITNLSNQQVWVNKKKCEPQYFNVTLLDNVEYDINVNDFLDYLERHYITWYPRSVFFDKIRDGEISKHEFEQFIKYEGRL